MHELDALQGYSGWTEGFETQHRSNDTLDGSVILLDEIVQLLDLADRDGLAGLFDERHEGGGMGAAFIDRDLLRETLLPHRLLEET